MIPTFIKKFIHHVGRRGVFLTFFGFLHINTGISWWNEALVEKRNFAVLTKIFSYQGWGGIFILAGLIMITASLFKKLEDLAFGLSAFLSGVFAFGIAATYLPGVAGPGAYAPRAMVTYSLYTVFILIVSGWPEASVDINKKELLKQLNERASDGGD